MARGRSVMTEEASRRLTFRASTTKTRGGVVRSKGEFLPEMG